MEGTSNDTPVELPVDADKVRKALRSIERSLKDLNKDERDRVWTAFSALNP